jgi:hypothetical protein
MTQCNKNCNQGRDCDCKGDNMTKHDRSDKWVKWLLIFSALYFLGHMVSAVAAQPIIINQPDGGQKVCIVSGGYVTCF